MSGRRLRHVNAEKKLEAREYGGGAVMVQRSMWPSIERIRLSVRLESVKGLLASSKRKKGGMKGSESDSKRLKICKNWVRVTVKMRGGRRQRRRSEICHYRYRESFRFKQR